MTTRRNELVVWILWLGLLAAVAGWLVSTTKIRSDLTAFLPDAGNAQESQLLQAVQSNAASRLIPVSISGASHDDLAEISRSLAERLREDDQFRQVLNGQQTLDPQQLEWVLAHRYHLSPAVSPQHFSVASMRTALEERLWELGSAEELVVKDLLERDPLHDSLAVASEWRPSREPQTHRGVWLDPTSGRALLMFETVAAGFELDAQEAAVNAIRQAYDEAVRSMGLNSVNLQLQMTGPGPFGVELRKTTQFEAQVFSTVAIVLLMLFLLFIYRSVRWVIIGALPLGTGLLVALLAVSLGYNGVHGITFAFAVTLLGVAIDYPLHLFSHHQIGTSPAQTMGHLWPTLRLGVLSTCIAYLTMVVSHFEGLAQLGWLTVIGLAVAAAATRWGLPLLMKPEQEFDASHGWAVRWHALLADSSRLPVVVLVLLGSILAAWLATRPQLWQNDLGSLTPVSAEKQQLDYQLRQAMAAPDLRYLVVIEGHSAEAVLQDCESLQDALAEPIASGLLIDFDSPCRYLPSEATQERRLASIPEPDELASRMAAASYDLPFKDGLFEAFIQETNVARQQAPLVPETMMDSPVSGAIHALLENTDDGKWRARLPMQGVADARALEVWFADRVGVHWIDLKQSSEDLVGGFRTEMLWRILVATGLIFALLLAGLRPRQRWIYVLLPVLVSVLSTAAVLHAFGVKLSLFHMTSLMLVAGIVLDYALFFDRAVDQQEDAVRTLHALTVCCVSTLTVFGILGLSQIPVLRAIGTTVACGVVLGYFLAILGRRRA